MVVVYLGADFKTDEQNACQPPVAAASGGSNLGLFTGNSPRLCSLAKCWPVIGHIRANL